MFVRVFLSFGVCGLCFCAASLCDFSTFWCKLFCTICVFGEVFLCDLLLRFLFCEFVCVFVVVRVLGVFMLCFSVCFQIIFSSIFVR